VGLNTFLKKGTGKAEEEQQQGQQAHGQHPHLHLHRHPRPALPERSTTDDAASESGYDSSYASPRPNGSYYR
jgi:hypothetical protein